MAPQLKPELGSANENRVVPTTGQHRNPSNGEWGTRQRTAWTLLAKSRRQAAAPIDAIAFPQTGTGGLAFDGLDTVGQVSSLAAAPNLVLDRNDIPRILRATSLRVGTALTRARTRHLPCSQHATGTTQALAGYEYECPPSAYNRREEIPSGSYSP